MGSCIQSPIISHLLESSTGGLTIQRSDGWRSRLGSRTAPRILSTLFFLPVQGTTVENICFELRYLNDTRGLARDHSLLLLCDLSHSNPDAVDVAIVSFNLQKAHIEAMHHWPAILSGLQSQFVTIVETKELPNVSICFFQTSRFNHESFWQRMPWDNFLFSFLMAKPFFSHTFPFRLYLKACCMKTNTSACFSPLYCSPTTMWRQSHDSAVR